MASSLRERQTAAITSMLTLSDDPDATPWKVLIYDTVCRDILSPLIKVGDLRRLGVTLHLSISGDRKPVTEVPAVYFICPTRENIDRLSKDIAAGLYESFYIHFASPVPRPLLEELATNALRAGATHKVSKVCDQYLNFSAVEHRLFSLGLDRSYERFNAQGMSNSDVEASVEAVVQGLFSAILTMGVVPVIRAPRGEAAEMIATKLERRIRDHLVSRDNLFSGSGGGVGGGAGVGGQEDLLVQRPLLLLLDRNIDLGIALHHSWVYQGMIHDLMGIRSNRVTVDVATEDGGTKTKVFDLEESDSFWAVNKHKPFPDVTQEADQALRKFKEDSEEIYRRTGASIGSDGKVTSTESVGTASLASAVMLLPELTERKKMLDMHMNLATSLMNSIKDRELDEYFSLEEALMSHERCDRAALKARLSPSGKGTAADKLRLLLIYFVSTESIQPQELAELEAAAKESGVDLASLAFLKKVKSVSGGSMTQSFRLGGAPSQSGGGDAGSSKSIISDLFNTAVGKSKEALKDATAAARKWLPGNHRLPVVRILDNLLEGSEKPESAAATYLYLDPKGVGAAHHDPQHRTAFSSAIVFMIGGGSYVENLELTGWATQQRRPVTVTYGATEFVTPEGLADQIAVSGGAKPKQSSEGLNGIL